MVEDFDDEKLINMSMDELDAMHEKVMRMKQAKAIKYQNDLIKEYQKLKSKMVAAGVVSENELPNFRERGWKRKSKTN